MMRWSRREGEGRRDGRTVVEATLVAEVVAATHVTRAQLEELLGRLAHGAAVVADVVRVAQVRQGEVERALVLQAQGKCESVP